MKHLFFKPWSLVLLPLLVSLACQSLAPSSPTAGTQAPEALQSVEVNVDFGPGPFDIPNPTAGLADLSSYTATLIMSFDGTVAGNANAWSKTYVMLTAKDPADHQLNITKTGDLPSLDPVFMAEVNGAGYSRLGENACNTSVIEQGSSLSDRLEPASFLAGVIGADEAGTETVNDTAANHYTFDERALGQANITKSTGELWVTTEGGYIVKYLLTTKGTADYFGEGIEGTLTFDYELTDVNKPVKFAPLPADCPPGLVDAPMLPDATNIDNLAGVLSYDTATSLADAVAFYQKQIPDLGWKAQGEPSVGDTDEALAYSKDKNYLTIIISTTDTGTQVHIVLVNAQK